MMLQAATILAQIWSRAPALSSPLSVGRWRKRRRWRRRRSKRQQRRYRPSRRRAGRGRPWRPGQRGRPGRRGMACLLVVGLVRREGPAGHEGGTAEGRGEGEAEDQQGEGHLQAEEALLAVSGLRFGFAVCSLGFPE